LKSIHFNRYSPAQDGIRYPAGRRDTLRPRLNAHELPALLRP
jgi:hypothetical protein